MRACRELGIESVAVYSDADADAPHVARRRPRRPRSGPAPPPRATCRSPPSSTRRGRRGADAVHPGYGFLSENAAFARGVRGGRPGLHRPARRRHRADGIEDRRARADEGRRRAGRARADAGRSVGRRRRRRPSRASAFPRWSRRRPAAAARACASCATRPTARELIPAARREAAAAFGDGTLYVERLIERPRHVEIQVFGDDHGNVVHLFERECSIQRRHQKVIEESPSPALTPALRARWARRRWPRRAPRAIATPARSSSCSKARATSARVLLPRDEHAAAGRASGHRGGHRRRSRARAADRRGGRAAAVDAGAR